MEDIFMEKLSETANILIEMLGDCEINVIEYVTDCVCNNGYVFLDDLQQLEKENNNGK